MDNYTFRGPVEATMCGAQHPVAGILAMSILAQINSDTLQVTQAKAGESLNRQNGGVVQDTSNERGGR